MMRAVAHDQGPVDGDDAGFGQVEGPAKDRRRAGVEVFRRAGERQRARPVFVRLAPAPLIWPDTTKV